jgi:hypothetical protein
LSLCEALRVLSETRLYHELGFPSLPAYADAFFQLRRAEAFEHVRVARALVELTELREAFGRGRIGWSVLKAITRVASPDSQEKWIDFAQHNGAERTLAEARDALRSHRDAPRDAGYGLPNLDQKLVLRFSRSEMEKVRRWLADGCAEVAAATGSDEVSPEQAILYLCEKRAIVTARAGAERSARAQLVYQRCPDCRRSRLGTEDGFVEVAPAEVERYEGCAEQVAIDGPTPPRLRRRVLAREAGLCGNPRCGHRADHCHHVVFRSRGGKTELANEVAVCGTCHALIHAGLLRVTGDARDGLRWIPVACGDSLRREVADGLGQADRLPVLKLVVEQSANADSGRAFAHGPAASSAPAPAAASSSAPAPASAAASVDGVVNRDDLALGLVRLGVPAARSKRLIDAAIRALPTEQVNEANVLRTAIRSI